LIYRGGGREVSKFKAKGLVVRRHLTFLSKEEHKVAAGTLFYKVKEEKQRYKKGDSG
jgi:hypothetical protein